MEPLDIVVIFAAVALVLLFLVERRRRRQRMAGLEPQVGREYEAQDPRMDVRPGAHDQRHGGYFGSH